MDSLLSNAQRCARKADSLASQGLFEDAFTQLDKSILFLNDLKKLTTNYETIQILNVQIESVDRKMRSIAIKRAEIMQIKNNKTSSNTSIRQKSNSANTFTNPIIATTNNNNNVSAKQKLLYRCNTITAGSLNNNDDTNLSNKNVSMRKEFDLPIMHGTNQITRHLTDDEYQSNNNVDDDDDDEDFYEETFKKTYEKQQHNNNDLNNTRSSTLTSSSSCCSSAFSSMSNLNSNSNHELKQAQGKNNSGMNKNDLNLSGPPDIAIDLSKYINNEDDDSSSDEMNTYNDAVELNNESFDEYFNAKNSNKSASNNNNNLAKTKKSFQPNEFFY